MATIAQMRNRMLDGHREILAALVEGRAASIDKCGGARGFATCRRTLLRWGAIRCSGIVDGLARYEITDIGRAAHR